MTESWSFRALGFTVNVNASFLVLLGIYVLFQLQAQQPVFSMFSWALVVFLSIVWHELGHALTARYLKVPVGDIELHGLGGHVTTARSEPRRQLLISLAGPVAGLTMGAIGIAIAEGLGFDWWRLMFTSPHRLDPVLTVLSQVLFINVLWSLINLLPIRPLDGGNALMAGLQIWTKDSRRAVLYTAVAGLVIGGSAMVWAYANGSLILALLAGYLTYQNYQVWDQVR